MTEALDALRYHPAPVPFEVCQRREGWRTRPLREVLVVLRPMALIRQTSSTHPKRLPFVEGKEESEEEVVVTEEVMARQEAMVEEVFAFPSSQALLELLRRARTARLVAHARWRVARRLAGPQLLQHVLEEKKNKKEEEHCSGDGDVASRPHKGRVGPLYTFFDRHPLLQRRFCGGVAGPTTPGPSSPEEKKKDEGEDGEAEMEPAALSFTVKDEGGGKGGTTPILPENLLLFRPSAEEEAAAVSTSSESPRHGPIPIAILAQQQCYQLEHYMARLSARIRELLLVLKQHLWNHETEMVQEFREVGRRFPLLDIMQSMQPSSSSSSSVGAIAKKGAAAAATFPSSSATVLPPAHSYLLPDMNETRAARGATSSSLVGVLGPMARRRWGLLLAAMERRAKEEYRRKREIQGMWKNDGGLPLLPPPEDEEEEAEKKDAYVFLRRALAEDEEKGSGKSSRPPSSSTATDGEPEAPAYAWYHGRRIPWNNYWTQPMQASMALHAAGQQAFAAQQHAWRQRGLFQSPFGAIHRFLEGVQQGEVASEAHRGPAYLQVDPRSSGYYMTNEFGHPALEPSPPPPPHHHRPHRTSPTPSRIPFTMTQVVIPAPLSMLPASLRGFRRTEGGETPPTPPMAHGLDSAAAVPVEEKNNASPPGMVLLTASSDPTKGRKDPHDARSPPPASFRQHQDALLRPVYMVPLTIPVDPSERAVDGSGRTRHAPVYQLGPYQPISFAAQLRRERMERRMQCEQEAWWAAQAQEKKEEAERSATLASALVPPALLPTVYGMLLSEDPSARVVADYLPPSLETCRTPLDPDETKKEEGEGVSSCESVRERLIRQQHHIREASEAENMLRIRPALPRPTREAKQKKKVHHPPTTPVRGGNNESGGGGPPLPPCTGGEEDNDDRSGALPPPLPLSTASPLLPPPPPPSVLSPPPIVTALDIARERQARRDAAEAHETALARAQRQLEWDSRFTTRETTEKEKFFRLRLSAPLPSMQDSAEVVGKGKKGEGGAGVSASSLVSPSCVWESGTSTRWPRPLKPRGHENGADIEPEEKEPTREEGEGGVPTLTHGGEGETTIPSPTTMRMILGVGGATALLPDPMETVRLQRRLATAGHRPTIHSVLPGRPTGPLPPPSTTTQSSLSARSQSMRKSGERRGEEGRTRVHEGTAMVETLEDQMVHYKAHCLRKRKADP